MKFFTVNHNRGGKRKTCLSGRCGRSPVSNQINLERVTEIQWEDGLWVLHLGPDHYRIHGEDNMKRLETELGITPPEADD